MSNFYPMRICTITPVRSPMNLNSEEAACYFANSGQTLPLCTDPFNSLFTDAFNESFLDWLNGYGTIHNDLLPEFFQPLLKRSFKLDTNQPVSTLLDAFCQPKKLQTACAELYIFDDSIAILRLDFIPLILENSEHNLPDLDLRSFDLDVTNLVQNIYVEIIYKSFQKDMDKIKNITGKSFHCNDPDNFQIFTDVNFKNPLSNPNSHVLWTGRYIVTNDNLIDTELKLQLFDWVAFSENDLFKAGNMRGVVGSGNSLVFSNDIDQSAQDWFRVYAISQLYYAILYIYGTMLKQITSDLLTLKKSKKYRPSKTNDLLESITKKLDHLVFVNLEFEDVKNGVQSVRKTILDQVTKAWRISELKDSIGQKSRFIRERLERIAESRKEKLNRSIEMMLTAIGGIALINIVLSLSSSPGNIRTDSIPGLIDLFSWIPPDLSLWGSAIFVAMMSWFVYRGRK